jgi:hypothetical protein
MHWLAALRVEPSLIYPQLALNLQKIKDAQHSCGRGRYEDLQRSAYGPALRRCALFSQPESRSRPSNAKYETLQHSCGWLLCAFSPA